MFAESAELAGAARSPESLAALARRGQLLVGDGAVRYRELFAAAGLDVPGDDDPRHLPRASLLAARAAADGLRTPLEPRYLRQPDAEDVAVAA